MMGEKIIMLVSALALSSSTVTQADEEPAGAGVLCMAGMMSVSATAAEVCFPEYNVEGQVRLKSYLQRLESYMSAQPGWGAERAKAFIDKEAGDRTYIAQQCEDLDQDADTMLLVKHFIDADANSMSKAIDELTARPGEPTRGDCL